MDARQVFLEKQLQCFMAQDPDEGFFDVTFEIEGKKLYADKFRLAALSTTFKSMLSNRWNSENKPIAIEGNTYKEFKEFLTFIYSGECKLVDDNIFTMIDLAECYHVEILKSLCDEYLSKMEISSENIFQMLDFANKYSMIDLKLSACTFFVKYFTMLAECDKFLTLDEAVIKELTIAAKDEVKAEDIFEAVYKWGEYQAELKKAESNDENFNFNDVIKNKLSELFPYIHFKKMKLEFLHKSVVLKAFIFPSLQDLSDILSDVISENYITAKVTVKATSPSGAILQGTLPREDGAVEVIKSLKNSSSLKGNRSIYWNAKFQIPSTPSRLTKREGAEWYLVYIGAQYYGLLTNVYFGIVHQSELQDYDYLLAEMCSEQVVEKSDGWKIEIV